MHRNTQRTSHTKPGAEIRFQKNLLTSFSYTCECQIPGKSVQLVSSYNIQINSHGEANRCIFARSISDMQEKLNKCSV